MGRGFVGESVCSAGGQGDFVIYNETARVKPVCIVVNLLAANVTRWFAASDDPPMSIPPGGVPAGAPTVECGHSMSPRPTYPCGLVALRVSGLLAPGLSITPTPRVVMTPGVCWGDAPYMATAPPWRVGPPAGRTPACTLTGASAG